MCVCVSGLSVSSEDQQINDPLQQELHHSLSDWTDDGGGGGGKSPLNGPSSVEFVQ